MKFPFPIGLIYFFVKITENKTRVLLCKRLSGQCRDVYMVVYFHLYWWWWAVVDCTVLHWAVLGCAGLYWSVLACIRLNWAVVGFSRLYRCTWLYWEDSTAICLCIQPFSARWQTNEQQSNQPGDPRASLLLTSENAAFCNNSVHWLTTLTTMMSKRLCRGEQWKPTSHINSIAKSINMKCCICDITVGEGIQLCAFVAKLFQFAWDENCWQRISLLQISYPFLQHFYIRLGGHFLRVVMEDNHWVIFPL